MALQRINRMTQTSPRLNRFCPRAWPLSFLIATGLTMVLWTTDTLHAQSSVTAPPRLHQAPPTPPVPVGPIADSLPPEGPQPLGTILYSIGDPTAEEQMYLEYINRARANPPAEGQRLHFTDAPNVRAAYNNPDRPVDLEMMTNEFNAIAAAAPLAFNPDLIDAARAHSQDMFVNEFQAHDSFDGTLWSTRIRSYGYSGGIGENIFAYSDDPWYGHAGFNVDWGPGPGNMQPGRGHRVNIHNADWEEIGIGVVNGVNGGVGPQLVTQDFGSDSGLDALITGVAYYDLNQNGFYDVGEGIGGLDVSVDITDFYAVTANSGGYAVPVPQDGTYTVTFSGPNLAPVDLATTVNNGNNVKVDFTPVYTAPFPQGPATIAVGQRATYTLDPVGGATRYEWRQASLAPFTGTEGAENGVHPGLTLTTSPGYDPLVTDIKASGNAAFHLAHPSPPSAQILELHWPLQVEPDSRLEFASRLGWSGPGQVARAQISPDGGASWEDLWTRPGTGNAGQDSFESPSESLGAYAGQEIRLRFLYEYHSGQSFFPQTDPGVGWYLDDITVTGAQELTDSQSTEVTSHSFEFTANAEGVYRLDARPWIADRWLDFGPALAVTASGTLPPSVSIQSIARVATDPLVISFEVQNSSSTSFQLESAEQIPSGAWSNEPGATLETLTPGSLYRFLVPVEPLGQRFYRVRLDP